MIYGGSNQDNIGRFNNKEVSGIIISGNMNKEKR